MHNTPASIRLASLRDASSIARVHVESWRQAYRSILPDEILCQQKVLVRTAQWRTLIRETAPDAFVYVAERESKEVVGFAMAGPERTASLGFDGELWAIYVLGAAQRKGIGRSLMRAVGWRLLEQGARNMIVWVLETNPSRGFYEALGGRPACLRDYEVGGLKLREASYAWHDLASSVPGWK